MLKRRDVLLMGYLLTFYGPVNVVELGRELRNSVSLHFFPWEALRVVCTLAKYNTTSNNRLKFIQSRSHTIFHWFI